MRTIAEMTAASGVQVVTGHAPDFDIPVLTGPQRQGDVFVLPAHVTAVTAVPATGCPVVRGESGGNTHAIHAADGPVLCDVRTPSPTDLIVANLVVPEGSTAYLAHPEHAFNGIGPGAYQIRRQREQADELRMVAD